MVGATAVMGTAGMMGAAAAVVVFGLGTGYENRTDQPCCHCKRLQRFEHDRTFRCNVVLFFGEPNLLSSSSTSLYGPIPNCYTTIIRKPVCYALDTLQPGRPEMRKRPEKEANRSVLA